MKIITPVLTVLLAFNAIMGFSQAGTLDSSFGTNGIVIKPEGFAGQNEHSMALQPDGKILFVGGVFVGNTTDFILIRYKPNGTIDKNFGVDGKVTTDFSGHNDIASSVIVQTDGKILVGGDSYPNFILVRYNPDGSLDSSFGTNGKVTTIFNDTYDSNISPVAMQSDGKIVLAGYVDNVSNTHEFALARYKTNGSPDSSFGENGKVNTVFTNSGQILSLAIQPDGKILAAGYKSYLIALARYKPNGKPDNNFGSGGIVLTNLHGFSDGGYASSIAIQPDKKIVIAGVKSSDDWISTDFVLLRYLPNGTIDSSFGNGGHTAIDFNDNYDYANSVVLQPDGKIIVAGCWTNPHSDFLLARCTKKGKLDKTFGINGKVITDLGGDDYAYSPALQPDGKLVVAGPSSGKVAVARYNLDAAMLSNDVDNISSNIKSDHSTDLKIYPNPVQSVLNIDFKSESVSTRTINICDINGKLVITKSVSGNTQIDVKQLTAGIYVIKINDENGKELYNGKFIKRQQ